MLGATILAGTSWSVAALAAWDTGAIVFLVWVWATIFRKDAAATASLALAEDQSRAAADTTLLGASVTSLVAVAFTLAEAGRNSGASAALLTALALASVALGWAAIHMVFTLIRPPLLHTAHRRDRLSRRATRLSRCVLHSLHHRYDLSGLRHGGEPKEIRHTVIRHALMSFLFGTMIIAVTINVVANLLNR
jgi:uncharacterized membrane protein